VAQEADRQDIAISSLYLSSKLNETPVRLRELINTWLFLSARIKHILSLPATYNLSEAVNMGDSRSVGLGFGREHGGEPWKDFRFEVPGFHDEVFWDWKDVIVASEMQILKRLGFNMQVSLRSAAWRASSWKLC